MATSNTLRAAAADPDLIARANALAAASGGGVTVGQMGQVVALAGIADAYESAAVAYTAHLNATPPPIGANLEAVTDQQLREALSAIGILPAE